MEKIPVKGERRVELLWLGDDECIKSQEVARLK
jgi:hypothetical protein